MTTENSTFNSDMLGWVYYVRHDSPTRLELFERPVRRLICVALSIFLFGLPPLSLAGQMPAWAVVTSLLFALSGVLIPLFPGYVVVDSTRRELRIRAGTRRLVLSPRRIPFDDVVQVIIWRVKPTGNPADGYYRDSPAVWLDLRDAGSIKIDSSRDDAYVNYLAHSLSTRIGVSATVGGLP